MGAGELFVLQRLVAAIGDDRVQLLRSRIVEQISFTALAAASPTPLTEAMMRAQFIGAVDAASRFFGLVDGSSRPHHISIRPT
jgi:hypothetical protein